MFLQEKTVQGGEGIEEILEEAQREAKSAAEQLTGIDPVRKGMVIGYITALKTTAEQESRKAEQPAG